MVKFHLLPSGTVRVHVKIPGHDRFRISTDHRVKNFVDQRATGKNSKFTNMELDRIEEDIDYWYKSNPIDHLNRDQIEQKLTQIITNETQSLKRKGIADHFKEFKEEKKTEINPKTKKRHTPGNINSYEMAFKHLNEFRPVEYEQVTKRLYHQFLGHLMDKYSVNHAGKIIRRLKTFFIWSEKSGLPINREYEFWVPINEETEETERALNSEQLDRIYRLEIDPVEVYQIAKSKGKILSSLHIDQLCRSIDEARRQVVAMASIGAHKEDFWSLTDRNVYGTLVKYRRGKNNIQCVAPFRDTHIFHAREFANMAGGKLFKRMTSINYYISYIQEMAGIPFKITASNFRKTFGSIIWYELPNTTGVNKMAVIMKAYGHKKESTTRKYLGIQEEDLERDHEHLFG